MSHWSCYGGAEVLHDCPATHEVATLDVVEDRQDSRRAGRGAVARLGVGRPTPSPVRRRRSADLPANKSLDAHDKEVAERLKFDPVGLLNMGRVGVTSMKITKTSPYNRGVISFSPIKLMVIAAVVMLLMGPDKLPEVAHKIGSAWRAVKRLQERVEAEVREAIPDLPSTGDIARIARSPVNLLNQLADRVDAKETASSDVREVTITTDPTLPPRFISTRLPAPVPVESEASPVDPSMN